MHDRKAVDEGFARRVLANILSPDQYGGDAADRRRNPMHAHIREQISLDQQGGRHQGHAHTGADTGDDRFKGAKFDDPGTDFAFRKPALEAVPVRAAGTKGQDGTVLQVCRCAHLLMHRVGDQHQFLFEDVDLVEFITIDRAANETDIDRMVEHLFDQRRGRTGAQMQVHLRVALMEFGQHAWQSQRGRGFHRSDPQFSGRDAFSGHGKFCFLRQLQEPSGVVQQAHAVGGDDQTIAATLEQFDIERFLELT